jgi:hypothetical protein
MAPVLQHDKFIYLLVKHFKDKEINIHQNKTINQYPSK